MSPDRSYVAPPPGVDLDRLQGRLIVIEGLDSSGRSTHIGRIAPWLEEQGHAVVQVGLRHSTLVSPELVEAKKGNVLGARTMSLFYATDFHDQMENVMVPALAAGAIVLADRYIFTLMARDLVRGASKAWVDSLYSRALVPDAVVYLKVSLGRLVVQALQSHGQLDYWESGMDLGLSRDRFTAFLDYQRRIDRVFQGFQKEHGFDVVSADRPIETVQKDLRRRLTRLLPD
jgi:dTMP kinase